MLVSSRCGVDCGRKLSTMPALTCGRHNVQHAPDAAQDRMVSVSSRPSARHTRECKCTKPLIGGGGGANYEGGPPPQPTDCTFCLRRATDLAQAFQCDGCPLGVESSRWSCLRCKLMRGCRGGGGRARTEEGENKVLHRVHEGRNEPPANGDDAHIAALHDGWLAAEGQVLVGGTTRTAAAAGARAFSTVQCATDKTVTAAAGLGRPQSNGDFPTGPLSLVVVLYEDQTGQQGDGHQEESRYHRHGMQRRSGRHDDAHARAHTTRMLSLTHTHSHTQTHTYTHAYTFMHAHTHTRARPHARTHTHTDDARRRMVPCKAVGIREGDGQL
jgi:hypothetical protein